MECRNALQIFLSVILLFAVTNPAHALVMNNLYTMVIKVNDNTLAERNKYLPQAFDQTMKKVSVSEKILQLPEYEAARQHLDRFVQQYSYTANSDNTYNLTLQFNEHAINNLLRKIGHGVLGKNRAQVLLWLVVDQQNQPNFVAYGVQDELVTKINAYADSYAMPIMLPLMDLTERVFITESDVLNFNLAPLQQASARYNTDTLLIGKINNFSGIWQCEWRLTDAQRNVTWHSQSTNLDHELEQMVTQLAEKMLVSNYSVSLLHDVKPGITLRVKGVQNVADYSKVIEHLKTLSGVQQVEIGSVEGNHAIFLVTADGGMDALVHALHLGKLLAPEANSNNNLQQNHNTLDCRIIL